MNPLNNTPAKTFPNENHLFNIEGFFKTLTEAPTYTPKIVSAQFVLVKAGGSTSAYIYDTKNTAWNYINLTTI